MSVSNRTSSVSENRLLAALPQTEYQRLLPELQPVTFPLGEVVYEFGGSWIMSISRRIQSCLCFTPWKTVPALKWG